MRRSFTGFAGKLPSSFYGKHLRIVSLVLGLEHSCPWPREGLSSKSRSLALALNFFVSLASSRGPLATPLVSMPSRFSDTAVPNSRFPLTLVLPF